MKIYLAVTKAKTPRIIAAAEDHEVCVERGIFLARGRKFEVVEKYLFLNDEDLLNLLEGCSLKHVDFVIRESTAHLPNEFEFDKVKPPMKVYLPGEFVEHMSALKKETNV
jgi:hypothetical protein